MWLKQYQLYWERGKEGMTLHGTTEEFSARNDRVFVLNQLANL